eukprot:80513-Prymnesium_polylepis.1
MCERRSQGRAGSSGSLHRAACSARKSKLKSTGSSSCWRRTRPNPAGCPQRSLHAPPNRSSHECTVRLGSARSSSRRGPLVRAEARGACA